MGNLFVAEVFGGAEGAVSGIADDHVDAAKCAKGLVDAPADSR